MRLSTPHVWPCGLLHQAQLYQTALAGPSARSRWATADALDESSAIFHTSMKFDPLSGITKYSSLKDEAPTEFEEPPLLVVGRRNSCSVMAPVSASRAKAET